MPINILMKYIILSFCTFFTLGSFAAKLEVDLSSVGWDYIYLNDKIKNINMIRNTQKEDQKAILERKIGILRKDENLNKKKFWTRRCPKLEDKMKVNINQENGYCTQTISKKDSFAFVYMFAQRRNSKKIKNSIYWNTVSFYGKKPFKVSPTVLSKIRGEFEKLPY